MRLILSLFLTATIGFLAGLRFEWWSIALVSFLVALLIPQKISGAFLSGFLGIFILWAVLATWIDSKNGNILSFKMAELFKLGGSSVDTCYSFDRRVGRRLCCYGRKFVAASAKSSQILIKSSSDK